jgi:hypothetical protein
MEYSNSETNETILIPIQKERTMKRTIQRVKELAIEANQIFSKMMNSVESSDEEEED